MDWKDIKPLKEFEARKLVKDYFSKHGFSCEEVDPSKLQEGQHSPDLIVRSNGNVSFYCEIKTPEHRLNPVTQMYHWDTIFYKLRRFLHTASKQFKDYDPKHEQLRVVVFTSNHPQLNWTNFLHNVVAGVIYNDQMIRDFSHLSFVTDSNKELLSIDMILWFQVNYLTKEVFQMKHFVNAASLLLKSTKEISNRLTPRSDEGIISR